MDPAAKLPEEVTASVFCWLVPSEGPGMEATLARVSSAWRSVVLSKYYSRFVTLRMCPVALARMQKKCDDGELRCKRSLMKRMAWHRGTVHISTSYAQAPAKLHYGLLELLNCTRGILALSWHDSSLASTVSKHLSETPPQEGSLLRSLILALWNVLASSAESLRYLSVRGKVFDEMERLSSVPRCQLVLPHLEYLSFSAAALDCFHCPALKCHHNFRFEPTDMMQSFLLRHQNSLQCIFMNYDERVAGPARQHPGAASPSFSDLETLKLQVSRGDATLTSLLHLVSDRLRCVHISQLPNFPSRRNEAREAIGNLLTFLCRSQRNLRTLIFEAPTCDWHINGVQLPGNFRLPRLEAAGVSAATFCALFSDPAVAPGLHTLFCRQLNLKRGGFRIQEWTRVLNSRSALQRLGLPGVSLTMPPLKWVTELKLLSGDCAQLVDFDQLDTLRLLKISGAIKAEPLLSMIDRLAPSEVTLDGRVVGKFDTHCVMEKFEFLKRIEFLSDNPDPTAAGRQLVCLSKHEGGAMSLSAARALLWPGEDVVDHASQSWWYGRGCAN